MLARGPIRLVGLHDQIEASLRERVGDSYALTLGPTYIMHNSWGVGLGFKGLTLRDAAGRTVLSAPGGKVGLDPFALATLDVKVRRLELDGLDLRLRVAADGALSLAVANDSGATPIPLPGAAPGAARAPDLAAFVRFAAEAMAGAAQALDRLTLANGHFEIQNDATQRGSSTRISPSCSSILARRRTPRFPRPVPPGHGAISAQASDGDAPAVSLEARDLSLADLQASTSGLRR